MKVHHGIDPVLDSLLFDCVGSMAATTGCGGAIGAMYDLMSPLHHFIKMDQAN